MFLTSKDICLLLLQTLYHYYTYLCVVHEELCVYYYFHLTGEETEGEVTYQRSHGKYVSEPGAKSRPPDSSFCSLAFVLGCTPGCHFRKPLPISGGWAQGILQACWTGEESEPLWLRILTRGTGFRAS